MQRDTREQPDYAWFARGKQVTAEHANPALLLRRHCDRQSRAAADVKAIVGYEDRQRVKAAAPIAVSALVDHASSGHACCAAALTDHQERRRSVSR